MRIFVVWLVYLCSVIFGGAQDTALPTNGDAKSKAEQQRLSTIDDRKSEALAAALSEAKTVPPRKPLTDGERENLLQAERSHANQLHRQKARVRTQAFLKEQIIPHVEFEDASLQDVQAFLNELAFNNEWKRRGIELLVMPPQSLNKRYLKLIGPQPRALSWADEEQEFLARKWNQAQRELGLPIRVDIKAKNIPVSKLLDQIRSETDYEQMVHDSGLVIWHEPDQPPREMEVADTDAARKSLQVLQRRVVPEIAFENLRLGDLPGMMTICRREHETDQQYFNKNGPELWLERPDYNRFFSLKHGVLTKADTYWAAATASGCRCSILPDGSLFMSQKSLAELTEKKKQ